MGAETDLPTTLQGAEKPNLPFDQRLRTVGQDLAGSLQALLEALPGAPHRPNPLAKLLGVNRAVTSRILSATAKRDPLEVLHLVPGPEPLRRVVAGIAAEGIEPERIAAARAAIEAFDSLIADEAGTRPALDALISSQLPGAREKFELSSKYAVYKGISQLKGVQADLWIGAAVIAPSAEQPDKHDLTWLNGAVAMQRLRPGVAVRFSYRYRSKLQPDDEAAPTTDELPAAGVIELDQFCSNPPAQLEARRAGDTIHYTLPDDLLGPKSKVDMFVVDHHPASMRRYQLDTSDDPGDDPERRRNSLFIEPAIPVANLVFDTILHDEAFPGSEPRLFLYDTGYDGIANVNDPARDIDRVDLHETIEFLGQGLERFHATELPSYAPMLLHLADRFGWDPARFRAYRTRIQYPVYGWQVSMSFQPPPAP